MKIVSIFANRLYAVRYKGQRIDELRRLMKLWHDPMYVYAFLKENAADLPQNKTLGELVAIIAENAKIINTTLHEKVKNKNNSLDEFFKPLNNQEYSERILSLQKGREQYLRLYAVKIGNNCFAITGGAIKFTHLMQDRPHTSVELDKIKLCRDYFNNAGVFDEDSFYELVNEHNND